MKTVQLMYLVDTNIVSELRKGNEADRGVSEFFYRVNANKEACYLSVVTLGEIRRGVEMVRHRSDIKQANAMQAWFSTIVDQYTDCILPVDFEVACLWADLRVPNHENALDKLIAATALIHSLQVVTRNIREFEKTGVPLLNPFSV